MGPNVEDVRHGRRVLPRPAFFNRKCSACRHGYAGRHQEITIKAVKPCSNNRKYVKQGSFFLPRRCC
ncbi:hypothetical protein JRG42_08505 [Pseudomonas granadensis]|uniref:Uncharacterized protein n=1 Tax=Pseudomonas granadensis TaxID=1421430 RepID=A0ABX7GLJ6_9PSED|nr:hypothetical protein [Pseudomonas granadensis]MBN6804961.1 hypothetical protein [Pseudomonas granadensis]MBN6832107.1 hypothetical protein [Pseudomonas granadensis]MBN6838732.1 hypothetical protein [Pseudomonas granadensis]MBN6867069.1 hypothetical protein [Pseudomonas granadensis]